MITPMSRAAAAQLETSIGDALYKCAGRGKFRRAVSVFLDYISAGLCVDLLADLEDLAADTLEEGRSITAEELDEDAKAYTTDQLNHMFGGNAEGVSRL